MDQGLGLQALSFSQQRRAWLDKKKRQPTGVS